MSGHGGPVMDLAFSPFQDEVIASASDDTTVKVSRYDRACSLLVAIVNSSCSHPEEAFIHSQALPE